MADAYRIRRAEGRDLVSVAGIEASSFADPWPAAAFRQYLGIASLVATRASRIVGYVFARTVRDEAEILNVAVHPEHRRRGIGRRLMRASMDRCREAGVREMYLEVRASNAPAVTMYAELGFESTVRRLDYYRDPCEDALVMRCDLCHGRAPQ